MLEEQFYESSTARWKRELPWLRLFRGFRIAMDFRKLLLAFAGTVIFSIGMLIFTTLPYSPHTTEEAKLGRAPLRGIDVPLPYDDRAIAAWPWDSDFPGAPSGRIPYSLMYVLYEPWEYVVPVVYQARTLLSPWRVVVEPARGVMFSMTWADFAWAWTKLLWALVVWAVFGGAIARIAALELAGEGVPSLKEAIEHSTRYLLSTLGGVLLPVVGVALFWGVALGIGMLGLIPGIGPFLTGLFYFVSVICGAILALILIGVAACWPLMYATIAVEGSDAFDALSRSYSYVFGRPWYGLWITIVSLVYGAILLLFLHGAMFFAHSLADHATAGGMGEVANRQLWDTVPYSEPDAPPLETSVGGRLRAAWAKGFMALSTVFVYSYFWVAVTIAYFLLRHAEDATPFKKVYWPAAEPVGSGPALSGMAAAEYRERQANEAAAVSGVAGGPPTGVAPG
ncbi:hypothetical protein Pan44_18700 [Caulifigura coniformis]|uniref:Uncharacterized protein n=1 Tax=Caulifigura coniformis TaxID=2527983 RepID=A0A517SCM1_9PLAN|nr:hypothetical protein [Caulifigura coniformis]QDT53846.1 hypothetical protein Pan44_18700 [Caulifigura coniformis]